MSSISTDQDGFPVFIGGLQIDCLMGIYERLILPRVIHKACSQRPAQKQREKVIPLADGVVLEVGIGSGLNLPHYQPGKISKVIGLDPATEITRLAADTARSVDFEVEFLHASGEEIPLEAKSIDTVVITYTLCSIPDAESALRQMSRVLKTNGKLVFCEHGLAPDRNVQRIQKGLNPFWSRLGGGCRLNRNIPEMISSAGFSFENLESDYIPGWKFASYNYWGHAVAK